MNLIHDIIFYEKLAYLFYAIAMADRKIVREEKKKIIEFVEKYWSSNMENSESKEIIYKTLRELIKNNEKAEGAFIIFKTFFNENKEHFTDEITQKIIETTDGIALSFGKGRNKSELILLTKLNALVNS